MSNLKEKSDEEKAIANIHDELNQLSPSGKKRVLEKFVLAALGSIPWIGGFISTMATLKTDESNLQTDSLQTRWLKEHEKKMAKLTKSINDIAQRFESLGGSIDERLQSEEYLDVVRKAFRTWDKADTDEKRKFVANLISNSAGTSLCSDDVVRLFIDWLDVYHESHLSIIREIYQNPGITRQGIWTNINGQLVREDSAEADLFKRLIRDLSTDGVIRQKRDINYAGEFKKKKRAARRSSSSTMTSAFEETKEYELTELGKQFVHYAMNEAVTRVDY